MRVKELKEQLEKYDDDMSVYIPSRRFRACYDSADKIQVTKGIHAIYIVNEQEEKIANAEI